MFWKSLHEYLWKTEGPFIQVKSAKISVTYGKWQVMCIILFMAPQYNDLVRDFKKLISLLVALTHSFL